MDNPGDEDDEGWGEGEDEEEQKGPPIGDDLEFIISTRCDKGYKSVKSENIKH